jgi:hydroxymethylpyrimidine/phosphomethylpyrimidine kinase
MARSRPVALSVAGSDSSGGAGVLADAATFRAAGVWPTVAITAVTAQNTVGVQRVQVLDPGLVRAQIESVVSDIGVDAVKTGMLGSAAIVAVVVDALHGLGPLVVDPVLRSTSGTTLLDGGGLELYRDGLIPLAALVTPNLAEASALTGLDVSDRRGMAAAGQAIVAMGAGAALVTGGHLPGDLVVDCLVADGRTRWFEGRRLPSPNTHGTGCVLSAAITARLALGDDLATAVRAGHRVVRAAIRRGVTLGAGPGPVDPGRG